MDHSRFESVAGHNKNFSTEGDLFMTRLALFDLDGTLADDRHRVPFVLEGDWAGYFEPARVDADTVLAEGMALVKKYQRAGYVIGYLTARRHVLRGTTEDWLDRNGFPQGRLYMKEWEETRPAANFKADTLRHLLTLNVFEEVVLFEDDPETVAHVNNTTGAHAVLITYYVKERAMVKEPSL